MLDECSQGTFVDEEVLQKLNISKQGRCTSITVKTISGESTESCIAIEGLLVCPVDAYSKRYETKEIKLPITYSSAYLPIDKDEVPTPQKLKGWGYLSSIMMTASQLAF